MIEFESTFDEQPPTVHLSLVYDEQDGRIVYMRSFVGDGQTGVYGPDAQDERERITLDYARKEHGESERLRVMHAPPDFRPDPEVVYRVNVETGQLEVARTVGSSVRERVGSGRAETDSDR
jgi:hypothetical protein